MNINVWNTKYALFKEELNSYYGFKQLSVNLSGIFQFAFYFNFQETHIKSDVHVSFCVEHITQSSSVIIGPGREKTCLRG